MHLHAQIWPSQCRSEVGRGAATATSVPDRHLPFREAVLRRMIIIRIVGKAGLLACSNIRVDKWVLIAARLGGERPIVAAVHVSSTLPTFLTPEIGQHMRIRPVRQTVQGPTVIIRTVTSDICHRVDRGRPADDAASRTLNAATAYSRVGFGEIFPIMHSVEKDASPGQRNVNPWITVPTSGF